MATNITGVNQTQPLSDPGISPNGNFVMGGQITTAGGGGWAESGDMYFEWDQGSASWVTLGSTGALNVSSQTNPITGLQTTTEQTITVYNDGTTGSFQVRVKLIEDDQTSYTTTPVDVVVSVVADECTADNLLSGTPALGTPDIGQEHTLAAAGIVSQEPVLATPDVGQEHALTANNIAAQSPVLGTPTCTEDVGDACTADNILAGTPVLGTPVIEQVHALTADNIASQNPTLGTPTVGQEHALSADGIASQNSVLGTPTAAVIHNLLAENIATGAPVIDLPDIGQEHVLTATSFDTGNPVLGTPTAGAVSNLTANSMLTGSPVLGTPTAAETTIHNLVALGIMAGGGGGDYINLYAGLRIYHQGQVMELCITDPLDPDAGPLQIQTPSGVRSIIIA